MGAGILSAVTVLVLLAAALRRSAVAGRDLATAAVACRRLGPGYSGGQPAATVRPPAPLPSGTIKPAPAKSFKPTS